jgi:phage regulator Rha-like protein
MFKLLLIKEFQRLKEIETNQYNLEWNVKRILTKTNYQIHTDAIKNHIIPAKNYSNDKEWLIYAEEADLLNVALFNCTAKDWREVNKEHSERGLRNCLSFFEQFIL